MSSKFMTVAEAGGLSREVSVHPFDQRLVDRLAFGNRPKCPQHPLHERPCPICDTTVGMNDRNDEFPVSRMFAWEHHGPLLGDPRMYASSAQVPASEFAELKAICTDEMPAGSGYHEVLDAIISSFGIPPDVVGTAETQSCKS